MGTFDKPLMKKNCAIHYGDILKKNYGGDDVKMEKYKINVRFNDFV